MTLANKLSTHPAWANAIAQPAQEFAPTPLKVISGEIPAGLRGSLYRNGPARLERGGRKVGHWFDGDGAILGVHFSDHGATGVYRFVQTSGYQEETAAGKYLYGNYGMTAPGAIWHQWLRPVKHSANTSVLGLPDKLLALWEGDNPYALDLETLETRGLDNLGGLDQGLAYSAHPKIDPNTGEIFNFGVSVKKDVLLNLYKSDRTGKIIKKSAFKLDGFSILHDFVLAGQYLVFFVPPLRINILPLILGLSSYSDAAKWKPQLGTQVLVFDKNTLTLVSRGETDPWFQWHFGNGYVDSSGSIILDIARYEDFQTNQFLKEVATGKTTTTAKGTLWQVNLNPQTGKVTKMQEVLDRGCDFPVVSPREVGQANRYTYLSVHRQNVDISKEVLSAIARFDSKTDTLCEAQIGENCYASEPIYAIDAYNPDQGWILTVVYDGNIHKSEVWIMNSDRLNESPVCKLQLPSVIPLGFHGTWKPA
ncbi:MAG TPA: carotenoid oxygenase family protein [Oculatellaceae cyanobacterium]|jgi:carotenoid cleavage dioxygenase-like enzyme